MLVKFTGNPSTDEIDKYVEGDVTNLEGEELEKAKEEGIVKALSGNKNVEDKEVKGPKEDDKYYCPECERNHKVDSNIGQEHLKYKE